MDKVVQIRFFFGIITCLCFSLDHTAFCGEERPFVFGESVPEKLPESHPIELSIGSAVLRALDLNYDVSIQRYSTEISRSEVMNARGRFEPALFGEAGKTEQDGTNTTATKAGLRTRWVTGTELSLSTESSEGDDIDRTTVNTLELRQPLLKDAGIAVNRSGIVIARRNRDISMQDLKRQMIDTASTVQDQYWDLVAAQERLAVEEDSLKYACELSHLTTQRATAGIMGESDTVEAQAAVYTREAGVARAAETVRSLEDSLKEGLVLTVDPANWEAPVVPTTSPALPETKMDFLAALSAALKNRPDYQAELLKLRNADLSLYVAKNQLLPRLDLGGRVSDPSESDDSLSDDEQVWSVFLSLEIPLGNKTARAGRDKARAEREQEAVRLKQLELQIIREVRRAVDSVNTSLKIVETTTKAEEFETRKLDNERTRLELGKSSTDNVVRFIESLNNARLNRVQAVVDCNRALVRLEQSQGTTLNQYGVSIE